jgi:hypothetical protein
MFLSLLWVFDKCVFPLDIIETDDNGNGYRLRGKIFILTDVNGSLPAHNATRAKYPASG